MSDSDLSVYSFKVGQMTGAAEHGNGLELSRMLEEIPAQQWRPAVDAMMQRNHIDVGWAQRQNDWVNHQAYLSPNYGFWRRQPQLEVPPVISNEVVHTNGNEILTIYQGNGEFRVPVATVKGYLPHHR